MNYLENNKKDNELFTYINAHINNISFPKSIEELEYFIYERGSYNVEDVIDACVGGYTIWTVPRNSAVGDIVLYFHAKTAIQWIRKLETTVKKMDDNKHNKNLLLNWLEKARVLYKKYGGKIFAIGRIKSRPELEEYEDESILHWKSRVYANVEDIFLLDNPIDIEQFKNFILVSRQSAITKLPSLEFQKLKQIILDNNSDVPEYFKNSKIGDYNLSNININNFLEITKNYRTRFLLEADFRSYYVNYFIETISSKEYYRECFCHTKENSLARVDNVFKYKDRYLLLEVKLNILLEKNIIKQLNQYINASIISLTADNKNIITNFERKYMYVIDMYKLYRYNVGENKLIELLNLENIKKPENLKQKFDMIEY